MPATYIAGYDGSDASRAALRFATTMADATDGEVIAAMVYIEAARVFGRGGPYGVAAIDEQSRANAEHVLAKDGVPEVMQRVVGARSPAQGLHRLAVKEHAALVAVGVTHHGPVGRLVPGSVGEHLLHGAPCPVAVVPADFTEAPLQTVAVAYHDSEESTAALAAAEDLARRLDARLSVIAVLEPSMNYAGAPGAPYITGELLERLQQRMKEHVHEVVDAVASERGADVRILTGPAGTTLVDACRDGVDLLVTGSRGYGPARSVLLGSVSRHVIDHAPCPVIVVPRGASADIVDEPAKDTA